jgi:hypothetical protein
MKNADRIFVVKLGKWENNIEIYLKETDMTRWTGFIWFRIRTSDGVL